MVYIPVSVGELVGDTVGRDVGASVDTQEVLPSVVAAVEESQ